MHIPLTMYLMKSADVERFWAYAVNDLSIAPVLKSIIAKWPANEIRHLRNRLYICLIGTSASFFLARGRVIEGYDHKDDLVTLSATWPQNLADCLVRNIDTYNVYMNLEQMFGFTW